MYACKRTNEEINKQMANCTAISAEEREKEEKIGYCWKNKRNVSGHIRLRDMYKSGYTRKDRGEKEGNGATMSC